MECSVCYSEEGSFCKLTCGHAFCTGCIKTWYLKGTGTGCPMCRRPIYFKGFHKIKDEWDEESYDTRCSEILGEAFDAAFEEALEMAEYFGSEFKDEIMNDLIEDFQNIESTFNCLINQDVHEDDIEYVLFETGEYYSWRRFAKRRWIDEPLKETATRYPHIKAGSRTSSKRSRALADQVETFTFYFFV